MGGRAKPEAKKAQIIREAKEQLLSNAVNTYKLELNKPEKDRKGSRTICQEFSDENWKKTGQRISLDHNTLLRRVSGKKS